MTEKQAIQEVIATLSKKQKSYYKKYEAFPTFRECKAGEEEAKTKALHNSVMLERVINKLEEAIAFLNELKA